MSSIATARRAQRGLTLILMLTILTLGTTYVLVQQMNDLAQRLGQDRATNDVLVQAKQALIGYAAQYAARPGALPCPDNDNNGWADDQQVPNTNCNQANERVGRLPWKTLGLPDLRDSAGERLWYALSDSLRDKGVVNSNSAGELTVYDGVSGAATATNVIAVIIAPGAELAGQSRSVSGVGTRDPLGATVADPVRANVANYLEGRNNYAQDAGSTNDNAFVRPAATATRPRGECTILGVAADCNDRVVTITHGELFSVVENMVASRLGSVIATFINSYFNIWYAYPFPKTFTDPNASASSSWVGTAGNTSGLLPLTNSKSNFTWITAGAGAPTILCSGIPCAVGSDTGVRLSALFSPNPRCSASTSTQLSCDIRYRYRTDTRPTLATITITARVENLGASFATFPDPGSGNMGRLAWSHFVANGNYFTGTGVATGTHAMSVPGAAPYLSSDGSQTITYTFPLAYRDDASGYITRTMTLDSVGSMSFVAEPFVSALTTTDSGADWFVRNEWYKLIEYAVAPGYAPGGAGSCSAPSCLTVSSLAAPNNNKGVVLVLGGRAIDLQARSTSAERSLLTNYFEAPNSTAGTTTFRQDPRSLTFNDRVVVVR